MGEGRLSGSGKQTVNPGSMRSRGHVVAFCSLMRGAAAVKSSTHCWRERSRAPTQATRTHTQASVSSTVSAWVGIKRRNIGFPSQGTDSTVHFFSVSLVILARGSSQFDSSAANADI